MRRISLIILIFCLGFSSITYANIEQTIDSLKQILRSTSEGETVDILNQLAEAQAGYDWEKSQRYAGLALELATSLDDKYGIAVAHTNYARFYNMMGDYRDALDHAALALSLFEQVSDDWQIARTLRIIGTTYRLLNQSDQSLDYFLRSLMIFEDIDSKDDIAATVTALGDVYSHWGQAEKALRFYERALALYKTDMQYQQTLSVGNRLAKTLISLEQYDQAISILDEMITLADEHPAPRLQAELYTRYGELYLTQKDYAVALKYYLDALAIFTEIGDVESQAQANSNVARAHMEAGNLQNALSYFGEAQNKAESIGESAIAANIWLDIGSLHMRSGEIKKAIGALQSGLKIAKSDNDLAIMQKAYGLLTEAYGKQGQLDKALSYQQSLQVTIDELNRQQSNRRVAELEIRYELDKLDKELDAVRGAAMIEEIKYKRRYTMMVVIIAFSVVIAVLFVLFVIYRSSLLRKSERDKMDHALRLKADFTAMLVHDLRSPLTAVFGFAEMLKMGEKSYDQIKEIAMTIRNASQKMLQLVNEMLDLSKFEAGKMTLSKTQVTLKPIVTTSIQMLEPVAAKREMKVKFNGANDLPTVHCDVLKVEQVITNLISNAINHIPEGSNIDISLEEVEVNQSPYLQFSVADNGSGIPEEERSKLFDKYAQLESRSSDKKSGTGLGLAVSRIIIEEHGGKIAFKPNQPKGSIFYFQIPVEAPKPKDSPA